MIARVCRSRPASIFGVAVLSAVVSGCVQSSSTRGGQVQPLAGNAAVATTDPVVLSGGADAAQTVTNAPPPTPPSSDIVASPTGGATVTAVETQSLPPRSPDLVAGQATEPGNSGLSDDGYPNINILPAEPTGELLTPEEREKLISELNALRRDNGAQ